MKIEKISITEINPAPYNPRKDLKPGDPVYEQLKRSVAIFDVVEPLIWNRRSGNLVGGHQRLKILQERGDVEVDVSVVDLDDAHEKALNIALNKITGDWDIPKLKELLVDLDNGEFDVSLTGFNEHELKDLIDFEGKQGLTDDDDAPALPETASCKRGDSWILGQHVLFCGDATNPADVYELMGGARADMVFTDPPYNVDYEGYTKDSLKIKNDKMSPEEFSAFLLAAFEEYRVACKDGASLYVCHPSSFQRDFQNALESNGFEVRTQIIWAKDSYRGPFSPRYRFQHEPIFYAHQKGHTDAWYGDFKQSTLWHEQKPAANRLHPTMKPVELVMRALTNSSKAGDIVLDLFGGSGSTLIACEKLNRRSFCMELDPRYCDVIVKRWEDFTGLKAEINRKKEQPLVGAGKAA